MQMVTIVMSSFGSPRLQALDRVDEYAFFLYFGEASPARVQDDLLNPVEEKVRKVRRESLLRSGSGYRHEERRNLVYPVFVDLTSGKLKGFGESKPITSPKSEWEVRPNCGVFWPTRKDGSEGRWQVGQDTMQQLFDEGV